MTSLANALANVEVTHSIRVRRSKIEISIVYFCSAVYKYANQMKLYRYIASCHASIAVVIKYP